MYMLNSLGLLWQWKVVVYLGTKDVSFAISAGLTVEMSRFHTTVVYFEKDEVSIVVPECCDCTYISFRICVYFFYRTEVSQGSF